MALDIIVVGAGIAGLAAARALREQHNVTILEQTRLKSETGAAIHLGPNAARLVLGWGCQLDESPHLNMLREADHLGVMHSARPVDAKADFGAPWLLNHRVTLHKELYRVATAEDKSLGRKTKVLTGARVASVDTANATVRLETGETLHADVIIGADGIKSEVRRAVVGDNFNAKPSGHSAYRCLIPAEKIAADEELAYLLSPTGLSIFLGKDRKLVVYTCNFEGRAYLNIVAAVPDKDLGEISEESWYAPGKVDDLVKAFSSFAPHLQRMLSYTQECGLWQLRDQDPLPHWVKGKAILIGDAAHPMLPHLGQGGSQAIEDADCLAFCFDGFSSGDDVEAALARTFKLRYERATVCQEKSREQALGKREEGGVDVPVLDPMQFAQYIFTYKGAAAWAAKVEAEERTAPPPKDTSSIAPSHLSTTAATTASSL